MGTTFFQIDRGITLYAGITNMVDGMMSSLFQWVMTDAVLQQITTMTRMEIVFTISINTIPTAFMVVVILLHLDTMFGETITIMDMVATETTGITGVTTEITGITAVTEATAAGITRNQPGTFYLHATSSQWRSLSQLNIEG